MTGLPKTQSLAESLLFTLRAIFSFTIHWCQSSRLLWFDLIQRSDVFQFTQLVWFLSCSTTVGRRRGVGWQRWFLAVGPLYTAVCFPFSAQAHFLLLLIHKGLSTTVNCSTNDNSCLLLDYSGQEGAVAEELHIFFNLHTSLESKLYFCFVFLRQYNHFTTLKKILTLYITTLALTVNHHGWMEGGDFKWEERGF